MKRRIVASLRRILGPLLALVIAWALVPPDAQAVRVTPYARYSIPPNIVFDRGTIINSRIDAYVSVKGVRWRLSMRAGSGQNTDSCMTDKGWAPTGRFRITGHWYAPNRLRGSASTIEGVAFRISNMKCPCRTGCHNSRKIPNGRTHRTALFIHSEMNYNPAKRLNVEFYNKRAPEGDRWDGNADFKSLGCLKVRPNDLLALSAWVNRSYRRNLAFGRITR